MHGKDIRSGENAAIQHSADSRLGALIGTDMSESETKTAALEGRVAELESQLVVFVDRAKDDDEQIRSLAQRVNEYGARYDEAVAAVDQRVADALAQFGARLYEALPKTLPRTRLRK
jgi:predicted  nucleic acid-binding Zn-ribbon protein